MPHAIGHTHAWAKQLTGSIKQDLYFACLLLHACSKVDAYFIILCTCKPAHSIRQLCTGAVIPSCTQLQEVFTIGIHMPDCLLCVQVFERRPEPKSDSVDTGRAYIIIVIPRGQAALQEVRCWHSRCFMGGLMPWLMHVPLTNMCMHACMSGPCMNKLPEMYACLTAWQADRTPGPAHPCITITPCFVPSPCAACLTSCTVSHCTALCCAVLCCAAQLGVPLPSAREYITKGTVRHPKSGKIGISREEGNVTFSRSGLAQYLIDQARQQYPSSIRFHFEASCSGEEQLQQQCRGYIGLTSETGRDLLGLLN